MNYPILFVVFTFFLQIKFLPFSSKPKHIGCDFLDWFPFLLKLLKHVINYKIGIKLYNLMRFIYYLWIYYKYTNVI